MWHLWHSYGDAYRWHDNFEACLREAGRKAASRRKDYDSPKARISSFAMEASPRSVSSWTNRAMGGQLLE